MSVAICRKNEFIIITVGNSIYVCYNTPIFTRKRRKHPLFERKAKK